MSRSREMAALIGQGDEISRLRRALKEVAEMAMVVAGICERNGMSQYEANAIMGHYRAFKDAMGEDE